MITYSNQDIFHGTCPKRLGPKEHENIFKFTQNEFIENIEFIRCGISAGLTTYGKPEYRSTATNIRLIDCSVGFMGHGSIFDEVLVDGVRTGRCPIILSGCAFRHVILKGNCGRFLFNRNVCHDDHKRNAAFATSNDEFYRKVDWALDISQIKTSGLEIRGSIPVDLIRRNSDEQFIMTRESAQSGAWKSYDPMNWFDIAINDFLDSQADKELFVASRRSRKFREELEFFLRLRQASLVY